MKAKAIYGPPGCGKTRKLVDLIPSDKPTAVFSHTTAAAKVLSDRAGLADKTWVSTMHSACFKLLGLVRSQVVGHNLKELARITGIPMGGRWDDEEGDTYLSLLKYSRVCGTTPIASWNSARHKKGTFVKYQYFCETYANWKSACGLFDFEDMLEGALLIDPPPVRRMILDEFQDFGWMQYRVLLHWLEKGNIEEVYFAGDDDQAIYGWNGGDSSLMLRMEKYCQAERIILNQSFRVPRDIQLLALRIISRLDNRVDKPYKPTPIDGTVQHWSDIKKLAFDSQPTMIVYRNHKLREGIEKLLITRSIPYTVESGSPGLFDGRYAAAVRLMQRYPNITLSERKRLSGVAHLRFKPLIEQSMPIPSWQEALFMPKHIRAYLSSVDVGATAAIRLTTIHGCKGDESARVIWLNGMSGRTNDSLKYDPDSERRCAYVAATRASERLDVVSMAGEVRWWR